MIFEQGHTSVQYCTTVLINGSFIFSSIRKNAVILLLFVCCNQVFWFHHNMGVAYVASKFFWQAQKLLPEFLFLG